MTTQSDVQCSARGRLLASLLVAPLVLACTASIDGYTQGKDSGSTQSQGPSLTPDDGTYQPFRGADTHFSKSRIWQLTPAQYQASVESALGTAVDLSVIQSTGKQEDFTNQADGLDVSEVYLSDLEEAVNDIVASHSSALEAQLGCAIDALESTCLEGFLTSFGSRLLRTSTFKHQPYLGLYDTLRTQLAPRDAFQGVVAALLLSPKALYRTELGDQSKSEKGVVALTSAEVAESLALSLWNGPPDAELLTAGASGSLTSASAIQTQVQRMLNAPNADRGMVELVSQWLGLGTLMSLEKNPDLFPEFTPELKAAMLAETTGFIQRTLAAPGASFATLLTSNDTQIDSSVGKVYGLTLGAGSTQVTLPADQRRGILTQPAVISAMSEPTYTGVIYRGKFLLRKLLCIELSPPAGLVVPQEVKDALAADATTRERLKSIESRDGCKTCHTVLHPMAFAMETYDTIGHYRTSENGRPIDASGSLFYTEFTQAPFQNAVQMIDELAASEEVLQCFVRQSFRYLLGRREVIGDDPTLRAAFGDFRVSHDMSALVTSIVQSESFRTRERM
ncbi:MAG TPA: DUF1592 domain-containing protein [Polyangiaceae bacterium]|nr:DUF1592 domain-containing protein [Polyangiaceae bacterium]